MAGYDRIAIPTVWVAFALSLLLHALALWGWVPKVRMLPLAEHKDGEANGSLAVRLAPPPSPPRSLPPSPPPSQAAELQPVPALREHSAPRHRSPAPKTPPVLALERPSPAAAPPPAEAPRPPPAPPAEDLASYIAARRRAREPAPAAQPVESEQARHNRTVAANLGLDRTPSFGSERDRSGGIFQIARMGYDDAEFFFFGWNKDIRRNSQQMIEVRRGNNPTMEIAVVRRMIVIIREHEKGDFNWESQRLGRTVSLSARMADNGGLEDFLMRDFFSGVRSR